MPLGFKQNLDIPSYTLATAVVFGPPGPNQAIADLPTAGVGYGFHPAQAEANARASYKRRFPAFAEATLEIHPGEIFITNGYTPAADPAAIVRALAATLPIPASQVYVIESAINARLYVAALLQLENFQEKP